MSIPQNNDLKYWLSFNQIQKLGPVRWKKVIGYFPDLKTAWHADSAELTKTGLDKATVDEIILQRQKINPDQELEKIKKIGCRIITLLDDNYPKLLAEIYTPPPLLYCLGETNLNQSPMLAVIGSRKFSSYGKQITENLVKELVYAGLTIVSGLALGIDSLSHKATIEAKGKTIAVLGSGINMISPSANYYLGKKIIESGGTVISEFPPGTSPQKFTFPQRNRIIAGLSLGTLIIEAAEKSGALITAHYALEQNREVFAVPGNIYNQNSAGTNNLIKLGAKMVTNINDILETLNIKPIKTSDTTKNKKLETAEEKILMDLVTVSPIHIDKLVKLSRINISATNATLSILEMKGLIKNLGNQNYVKIL